MKSESDPKVLIANIIDILIENRAKEIQLLSNMKVLYDEVRRRD